MSNPRNRQAITDSAISSGLSWLLLGVGAVLVVLLAVMGLTNIQKRSVDAHEDAPPVTETATTVVGDEQAPASN